ncbi:4-phosphoerythronate dehydrogenase [Ferrimonas senticii]|uniref:4-phosphoerythronate dehydrogenase n=1 Tax=Ferrimonas senticii TaxID=394566 RepID=UPI0003FF107B|nr:4-phosphoerythronate dehydrogenase [Ferrimonas senticii]
MKFVADENMAALEPLFAEHGEIVTMAGREISADTVPADTTALLLRSVTKVDATLLDALPQLQFVGTATIGTDHLDIAELERRGIGWSNAAGCNAQGVGEYVLSALLLLAERSGDTLTDKTIGIVGLGNTGSAVAKRLAALGCNLLLCDPPKQAAGELGPWVGLDTLIAQSDVITLHVPLQRDTHHLFDAKRLATLNHDCWLINASRGEVIDNRALIELKPQRPEWRLVMDVWEHEPNPLAELVSLCELATPHIAGYSVEGKIRGTQMLHQALFADAIATPSLEKLLTEAPLPLQSLTASISQSNLQQLCASVYDLALEDRRFRAALPDGFDARRKANLTRREFCAQPLATDVACDAQLLRQLGFLI